MHARHISARFPEILGRLIILVSILLLNIGTPPPAAQTANAAVEYSLFLPLVINGTPDGSEGPPPSRTAQQLIQEDLAAGLIDANTALLYRAYALYGDPRLPEKYGDGFMIEDPLFFDDAQDPNLPADVKAQLEPFLARPDDPMSIYNTAADISSQVTAQGVAGLACDAKNWTYKDSMQPEVKIRVHSICTEDYDYAAEIETTLQHMDALWGPMTQLMGKPRLDWGGEINGGSYSIDIYLVTPLDKVERHNNKPMGDRAGGVTVSVSRSPDDRSSAYIMVDRNYFGDITFKQILAHEFFHVLQDRFNYNVHFADGQEWWFTEASATWAEVNFVPSEDGEVHKWFTNHYQAETKSLLEPGTEEDASHTYAAYIWPFFIEQEKSDLSIANIWESLVGVGEDWELANQMVDQELPFWENFRRFALRNLNVTLEPGDPIRPRYISLDQYFPDQKLPRKLEGTTFDIRDIGPMPDPMNLGVQVPALAAEYYHFTFTEEVLSVKLDLSKVAPLREVAVEALVKERGGAWALRKLYDLSAATFCEPEEVYLIISNESMDMDKTASVSFTLSASDEPAPVEECYSCRQLADAASWDGRFTLSYSVYAGNDDLQVTQSVNLDVNAHLVEDYRNSAAIGYRATELGGNGEYHYRNLWLDPVDDYLAIEMVGSGTPVSFDPVTSNGSRMSLSFFPQTCTYTFYVKVWVNGTWWDEDSPPTPVTIGIAHAASADRALPDSPQATTLTGSESWPARSDEYILSLLERENWYALMDGDIYDILGPDGLGVAEVSWSFTPSAEP